MGTSPTFVNVNDINDSDSLTLLNYDIHRVKGINALALNIGDTLTLPHQSSYISFWALTTNNPSWSLYTADNTSDSWSIKRNNETDTSSDITLSTSNSNIHIYNNSPFDKFPDYSSTTENIIHKDAYTTSFEITGNTYDAGVYEITSNVPLSTSGFLGAGPQHIFSDYENYFGVIDVNNKFSLVEIEIKLPKKIILSKYTFFRKRTVYSTANNPSDWTLYTKVDNTWREIDSRSSQGSTVIENNYEKPHMYSIFPVSVDTLRFVFTLSSPQQVWHIGELQLFKPNPVYRRYQTILGKLNIILYH